MDAKLTISDRFAILSVLPVTGNFATLTIVRNLREQLSLAETEIKEYEVVEKDGQILWKNVDKTVEMSFGEFATSMIQTALKKLNETEKLEERHFNVYQQFIGE